ncbi:MAG TPA: hypothetical protein VLD16_03200, partial [Gaiellaceae bacterium]|nr:hypothetical protein [Gaiellaceae bacterium]
MPSLRPEANRRAGPRWAAALGVALAAFATTSAALATFTSSPSVGGSYVTKRIFPGVRSAWPWDVRDASGGGAETNSADLLSYVDGRAVT